MKRQEMGILGEKLACKALKKAGYRIIESNYRCRQGEIDIIGLKDGCLVFVEVRSKTGKAFGTPEESVTGRKQQKLIATAMDYLGSHPDLPENWRIDVVALEIDAQKGKAVRTDIIENAIG